MSYGLLPPRTDRPTIEAVVEFAEKHADGFYENGLGAPVPVVELTLFQGGSEITKLGLNRTFIQHGYWTRETDEREISAIMRRLGVEWPVKENVPGIYSRCVPSSLPRVRSNVPSGR